MIRKIPLEKAVVGMYVHDINCEGLNAAYLPRQFMISDVLMLQKLRATNVPHIFIDTARGLDVIPDHIAELDEWAESIRKTFLFPAKEEPKAAPAAPARFSYKGASRREIVDHANKLYSDANNFMQATMNDLRVGKHINVRQCERAVDDIMESVLQSPSVMLPLVQIKTHDDYTYQHSVAVAALAVIFGQALELPRNEIREVAFGGLLHDVGKARVPGKLLNKIEPLEPAELAIMESHATHTISILQGTAGISSIAYCAATQHHERVDGSGYPYGLQGGQVSLYGQIIGIIDTYDAMISPRAYQKGMPQTEALRKLFEWSKSKFDNTLVQAFIKALGIYPVGSLVRLESGKLAVVREVPSNNLLNPTVLVMYDCKEECHVSPTLVNLSMSHDRIANYESFDRWGIARTGWI
jgi:HD-GYP domain-containing protein (c-di-GMP phosphodiesterase class II)